MVDRDITLGCPAAAVVPCAQSAGHRREEGRGAVAADKRSIDDRGAKGQPDRFAYPLELLLAEVVPDQRLHPLDNACLWHVERGVEPVNDRKHAQGAVAADMLEQVVGDDHYQSATPWMC